jgi:hypothetical protein
MIDPTAEIRETVRAAVAAYCKMKPNSAEAFEAVTKLLARNPSIGEEHAEEMARGVLKGSYRAWRKLQDARNARLMAMVRRGGRLN